MMYTYAHRVLENLLHPSVPIAIIALIVSFLSYRLNKRDIRVKYSREITSRTIERLELFYSNVIPLYDKVRTIIGDNFFYFENKVRIIDCEDKNIKEQANNYYAKMKDNTEFIKFSKQLLVSLQSIALSLEKGIADYEFFTGVFRDKYTDIFETIFPVLMQENDKSIYKSSISLFEQLRIEKEDEKNKQDRKEIDSVKATMDKEAFRTKDLYFINPTHSKNQ